MNELTSVTIKEAQSSCLYTSAMTSTLVMRLVTIAVVRRQHSPDGRQQKCPARLLSVYFSKSFCSAPIQDIWISGLQIHWGCATTVVLRLIRSDESILPAPRFIVWAEIPHASHLRFYALQAFAVSLEVYPEDSYHHFSDWTYRHNLRDLSRISRTNPHIT